MTNLLYFLREVNWLAVGAIVLLVVAFVLTFTSLVVLTGVAAVGSVALAILSTRA